MTEKKYDICVNAVHNFEPNSTEVKIVEGHSKESLRIGDLFTLQCRTLKPMKRMEQAHCPSLKFSQIFSGGSLKEPSIIQIPNVTLKTHTFIENRDSLAIPIDLL